MSLGKVALLALLASCIAVAQEFRALISGSVTDSSGAPVVGATVKVTNVQNGSVTTVTTGADGNYVVSQLIPGSYELTAEAAGFRRYTRRGITLAVGDKAAVPVQLELGALAESITVTAALTGIESNQSVMGQLMDNKSVSGLPLNGRQVFMLLQLSAGVLFTQQSFGSSGFSGTRAFDANGVVTIHGSRPPLSSSTSLTGSNEYLMDGALQGVGGFWTYAPLVDAVAEFKVSSPINDASLGPTGGGVVNMAMKSGTNTIHGLASEFIRNNIFDAVSTQTNRAAAQLPDMKTQQHQFNSFGAMISGPVIANKFFYSGHYEGFRERVPFPVTVSLPTLEQRIGDFSKTLNSASQLITIYDPLSTTQQGSAFVRTPFANNKVPLDRIVPAATNILKYVPQPNIVTNPITNQNNFAATPNVGRYGYDAFYVKFDYVWNERQRSFFSFTENWGYELRSQNGIPIGNPAKSGSSDPLVRNHYGATLDHVSTISATTVLNMRLAWDRFVPYTLQQSVDNYDGSLLGFQGQIGSVPKNHFPYLTFVDYSELSSSSRSGSSREAYSAVVDVSKMIGRHFLKFGTRLGQARYSSYNSGNWYGAFGFDRAFTQKNPQSGDSTSGNSIAAFLLGYPSSGGTDTYVDSTYQNKFVGLYVQDDIKLAKRLTLNVGLRWDVQTAPTERFNRAIRMFDPNISYTLGGVSAKGGFVYADKDHRQPWETGWRDFQPRLGMAYQLKTKLVFRAGYGLTFIPVNGVGGNGSIQRDGYTRRTPFVATAGGGLNSYVPGLAGTGTFEIPFPTGILQPFGNALGPKTGGGQAISYYSYGYVIPRAHQLSFGFDYELPWKLYLEASYVGSLTRKFPSNHETNFIPLQERLKGVADPNYLNATVANPYAGAADLLGTALYASTVTRAQSLLPFPQFTGVVRNADSIGSSSYHALEARLNKRLSQGLVFTASYTFGKTIEGIDFREPQYSAPSRVLTEYDRRHHFTFYTLYEFPIGKGKRFGSQWGRGLDAALGNWQYNFVFEHGSGTPTPMPDATPVGDPRLTSNSLDRYYSTCTLLTNGSRSKCASADEPVAWIQLKPNELRTFSSRFPNLTNPWKPQINMSLFKSFRLTERLRLEFRAEAFNAFNTPIYRGPDTAATTPSVTSANFGVVIRDQQNFPRNMQFALRLQF